MPSDKDQSIIVIEEERLKERFTQIPNTILSRQDLTPGAKLAYIGLLSYAWQDGSCFPGQQALATYLGVSKRSIISYLQELQKQGLLRVRRRGLGQTNIYTLSRWVGSSRSAESALPEVQETTFPEVRSLHTNRYSVEKDSLEKNSVSSKGPDFVFAKNQPSRFSKKKVEFEESEAELAEPVRTRRSDAGFQPIGHLISSYQAHLSEAPQQPKTRSKPVPGNSSSQKPSIRDRVGERSPWLLQLISDISSEFHDEEHTDQNLGQALRLWDRSGVPQDTFCQLVYEARSLSKQYRIKKRANTSGDLKPPNRMPYFFTVLKDKLGLKQETPHRPGAPPG